MIRLSSREFNQNLAKAKRAAREGTVVITDRGRPAFVMMDYERYTRLSGESSLADALDDRVAGDVELPIPQRRLESDRDFGLVAD